MFGSLIRRKEPRITNVDDGTFGSTTFSLSTAVPRPSERRSDERVAPTLRVAKLEGPSGEQLVRVRNVSAGGLMAEAGQPVTVGDAVTIELSSQKIPGSIVWIRDGTVGVKFDQNIDLGELLAGRKPRHGFRSRPPRLEVSCKASLRVDKTYYTVDVHDISLGGMKVEPIEEILPRQEGGRGRGEPSPCARRDPLVFGAQGRHRFRRAAVVRGAGGVGREAA